MNRHERAIAIRQDARIILLPTVFALLGAVVFAIVILGMMR
jgi:hypothetical protein